MSPNEQPKTKKQSTSTTQIVVSLTSTHPTEIAAATGSTTLDACPDEILLNIAEFTGAHSCYLGYGIVDKRINQLFNTYSTRLSKSSSYGGYAPFQEIVEKCKKELKREKHVVYCGIPKIFHELASGAVDFNRTDLLEWAMKKKNKIIHRAICENAVLYRKLSIFEKVWDSIENENVISYMKKQRNFIRIAAGEGYLDWLVYLREELKCEWNKYACEEAARGGNLDCLKYLHENGCEWDKYACSGAARGGNLDCLKYLHENGCEWNNDACIWAAHGGNLDCLKYLHKNGCEWDKHACLWAARRGHLDCLKYLHENGCGWDWWACEWAVGGGFTNCLVWDEWACSWAVEGVHLDCLQYMRDNGLEWDHYDEYLGSTSQGSDP